METYVGDKMSDAETLPRGKQLKCSQRKRTVFTEEQLAGLKLLFKENPYPSLSVQREVASRMDIHPTVLQVWFKNYRAKVRKAKSQHRGPKQPDAAGGRVRTPSPKTNMDAPPCSPQRAGPTSLVYTHLSGPSFLLHICPAQQGPAEHPAGHRVVHFGCCQDPNIYYLSPILDALDAASIDAHSPGSPSPP